MANSWARAQIQHGATGLGNVVYRMAVNLHENVAAFSGRTNLLLLEPPDQDGINLWEEVDSQAVIDAQQAVTYNPDIVKHAGGIETIDISVENDGRFRECGDICCMGDMVAGDEPTDIECFRAYCGTLIPTPSSGKEPSLIIHGRTLNSILADSNTLREMEDLVV